MLGLTAEVFVGAEAVLDVSFDAARAGLARAVGGEWLATASADAYGEWSKGLARVGPRGTSWSVSRLVEVRFRELVTRGNVTGLALRWEAAGSSGGLFPVLDADITLVPDGEQATLIGLDAVYRPPPGPGLCPVITYLVTAATIRSLLGRIAAAVAEPAPPRGQAGCAAVRPGTLAVPRP